MTLSVPFIYIDRVLYRGAGGHSHHSISSSLHCMRWDVVTDGPFRPVWTRWINFLFDLMTCALAVPARVGGVEGGAEHEAAEGLWARLKGMCGALGLCLLTEQPPRQYISKRLT